MANDKHDNNNKVSRERLVTQDSHNSSVNMGRKSEPAALDFDFEKKPEKKRGLPDTAELFAESERNKAAKRYGLSDDYRDPMQDIWESGNYGPDRKKSGGSPSEGGGSELVESFSAAKEKLKQKLAERQELQKAAKEASIERRRQLAREEAIARAAREELAREKAAAKEELARERAAAKEELARERAAAKAKKGAAASDDTARLSWNIEVEEAAERERKEAEAAAKHARAAEAAAEASAPDNIIEENTKTAADAPDASDAKKAAEAQAAAEASAAAIDKEKLQTAASAASEFLAGAGRAFISFFNMGVDDELSEAAYDASAVSEDGDGLLFEFENKESGAAETEESAEAEEDENVKAAGKAAKSEEAADSIESKNKKENKESKEKKDKKETEDNTEKTGKQDKDKKSKGKTKTKTKTASAPAAVATVKKAVKLDKSRQKNKNAKAVKPPKAANKGKTGGSSGGGKTKKKKPKRRFGWLWAIFKIMFALIIAGGIAGGAYVAYTISNAPTIRPDQIYSKIDVSTHIYDDKGKLISDIFYSENRDIAKYEELPDNLKNAFIAIEDKTFWEHNGFNFRRMFGAVWNSVSGGGEISGTSTITQQLARNVFLPEEKSVRSIKRKIIEMYYAREIEEVLSKEEILTAYLNTIYLGYGCYGVDTASRKYFSAKLEDLTLEQCAALAALPQAPGVYALLTTEPDENSTEISKGLYANDISAERRNIVLDLMAEQGYISAEEAAAAKKPLTEFIKPGKDNTNINSAFKDYLLETVIHDLTEQYALSEEQATKMVYAKGLHIYSTLDSQAQKVITKEFKKKGSFPKALKDNAKVEAAMVITEVGTGQIKAMAGTRDASGEKLFNRATSPRQPGSSIKPLAVYAPALQKSYEYQKKGQRFQFVNTGYDSQGKNGWGDYITAISMVKDEKMTVNGKVWPQNFSRSYSGFKTFRTAIQQSINTCAVKILSQIGIEYSMDTVKKFGISTVIDDTSEPYNDLNLASLALGAMTEGVTPLDMSLAYATFPNGGVRNSGICYTKVTDSDGEVLLEGKSEETRVLDEGVAYIMTDVLQTVVSNGIAYDAAISGERVGGKTGTTDQTWDIWFDGFTPKYSAALWIGTDDNTELNTTSATAAALWSKIMSKVKRAKGGTYKSRPSNVILKNGEYFTTGTQPPDPPPVKKEKKDEKAKDGKTNDQGKKEEPAKTEEKKN